MPVVSAFDETSAPAVRTVHVLGQAWLQRLNELGLQPAPAASQRTLLRRIAMDLVGRPPTPDEIATFDALPEAKRARAMSQIYLKSAAFNSVLSEHLWRWFEVPFPSEDQRHTEDRDSRLRAALADFAASDSSAADLIGFAFSPGVGGELVRRFTDPRDRAEFAGRAFLGVSIGCARCHNHPLDRWSQAQHLQFSAFFTDADRARGGSGAMMSGEFYLPGDGKPVEPVLLPMGRKIAIDPKKTRSGQLRTFFTEGNREQIARNLANRVFGVLTGRFLVDAEDDHRITNPAVHEPVLEALTTHLLANDMRLRPLFELITTSQVYAASSAPPDARSFTLTGDPAWRYLARREARALTSRQFHRAVEGVLGVAVVAEEFPETPLAGELHLLNSGQWQRALAEPGNQVGVIFDFESDPAQQLHQLYELVLSRPPRPEEVSEFLPMLQDAGSPESGRAAGRDLAFALLASREFSSIR